MRSPSSLKRLSRVLRQTLQDLEQRQDIDPRDPAFISLKCTILARALDFRAQAARIEARIHLIDRYDPDLELPAEHAKGEVA